MPPDRRAARPHPAAPAARHRPVVRRRSSCPKGPGSSTSSRCVRGGHHERFNDPLNPRLAHSPMGSSSVCFAHGYEMPDWTLPDPEARPGELVELVVPSRALRRDSPVTLYLPARFRRTARYPLLVVHDGGDYLQYAAAQDRAGQPDPPPRRGRDRGGVHLPGRPAGRVRQLGGARPVPDRRAAAAAGAEFPLVGDAVRPVPDGRRASARSRRCPPRTGTRTRTGRCCCSRARSSSPTSATTTAAGRRSTRW